MFKAPTGQQSEAQIEAFEDTWHWNDNAESDFDDVMKSGNGDVAELLRVLRSFLKENDMMAYITMMAARLLELHRVLKPVLLHWGTGLVQEANAICQMESKVPPK